jgi:hypothetical protein
MKLFVGVLYKKRLARGFHENRRWNDHILLTGVNMGVALTFYIFHVIWDKEKVGTGKLKRNY